jgi:two-component system OmpR family sensor kinase
VTGDLPPETVAVRRFGARSFRSKIVLSTVAVMSVAMVVMGLGVQILLDRTARNDINTVLDDRAEAMVTVIQQASTDQLTVPPDSLEPGMEVFNSNGELIAGSVEREVRDVALDLGTRGTRVSKRGPHDEEQLLGVPFTTRSGDRGVLVVSQETGPYERSEFYALLATGGVGLLVIAFTAMMALRVTKQALEPVTQMAQRAAEWSEHDLDHRFALGPPTNELASLGNTMDQLLDRVASAILAEQRLTAELAHELRTPLTSIQGSAGLALMRGVKDPDDREDFEEVAGAARDMSVVIQTLLDVARDNSSAAHGQTCRVADVMTALRGQTDSRVEVVDETIASRARIAAPRALVLRAIAPLVDNAVRHARGRVVVSASDHADHVELVVADDGAGVAPEIRESLFEPGATHDTGGAGLGLGIARRVARSIGGDVTLDARADLTAFVVTLPRR